MWSLWLVFAGVFFIAEIITTGFLMFWLGFAALISMVASLVLDSVYTQTVIFLISSCLLLLSSKYFFSKIMKSSKSSEENQFSIIGKKGLVTYTVDSIKNTGLVKIGGEDWSAQSSDGSIIPEGTNIIVTSIEGVKAIVTVEN